VSGDVAVIVGAGGMGVAIVRRIGAGRTLLLADHDEKSLAATADALRGEGHHVVTRHVDVAEPASVASLAAAAAALGPVTHLVHTAGLSPVQASPAEILRVDLLGVALVLDEFERVVAPRGAGVVIASTAAHLVAPLPPEHEGALATTPPAELLALPFLSPDVLEAAGRWNGAQAYGLAKRANIVRVRAAALSWGRRGARVNSVSPGVISTSMGRQELAGTWGASMRRLIDNAPAGRVGTPDDVADAVSFLLGPQAGFITGTDLVVDGGSVAFHKAGERIA
jgi:NAD(P)-dependent dehydrogenase (short-subunit alcohol dehydrogenase family)